MQLTNSPELPTPVLQQPEVAEMIQAEFPAIARLLSTVEQVQALIHVAAWAGNRANDRWRMWCNASVHSATGHTRMNSIELERTPRPTTARPLNTSAHNPTDVTATDPTAPGIEEDNSFRNQADGFYE